MQEQLILKGVDRKFDGQTVWFSVDSLNKHYNNAQYNEADVIDGYIKASDIFGDNISENVIEKVEQVEEPKKEVANKKSVTKKPTKK